MCYLNGVQIIPLGLVEASQVKFGFYDERAHRSMAETGFLTSLLDRHALLFTFPIVHNLLDHFNLLFPICHAIHLHIEKDGVFLPILMIKKSFSRKRPTLN